MSFTHNIRLLLIFSVAFSLVSLTGAMSSGSRFPSIHLANANLQQCQTQGVSGACSEFWYPSGPEMNTLTTPIFTDYVSEFNCIQASSPCIDFTDSPLPPSLIQPPITSPNFVVSAPVPQTTYYEIQFLLANTFWNCNFSFGDSACGVQIRQGIAHMIDKRAFTNNDPNLAGEATPIDNPVPTSSGGGLLSPDPCGYDASFPQSGTDCLVGAPGGTAYHIGAASGANGFPWLYAPGGADLNAAAQHFVNAGLATGFNATTSVLTGISGSITSNPPTFFIRNDDSARLNLGNGLAEEICYLFTGSYNIPCTYFKVVYGRLSSFPGFTTCLACTFLNWWMYTAAFSNVRFFDDSLYFGYNSRFVSGNPAIQPPNGPCSPDAIPTNSASNYVYLCNPTYDSFSSQMEFAPCLNAPGDPVQGATSNLPTSPGNGLCSGTSQLSAHSAGIQAEAIFGASAFTIPVYEKTVRFAYLNGWIRAVNNAGTGIPNYFTWLNTYNPSPATPGTIRQGFSESTRTANPFIASTVHDFYIVNEVYDSLYQLNPLNSGQAINWMTINTQPLSNSSLTYPAPAHTVTTYRFFLRSDMFFQDGRLVTSYDVAFSYLSMLASGALAGSAVTSMTGMTILGPHQFDIGVSSTGPFILPNLTGVPIVPGRYWTNAESTAWDSAVQTCTSMPSCPSSQYTLTGSTVNCSLSCTPFTSALMTINPADTSATFDPISAHIFVGSGAYECGFVTSTGSGQCTPNGTMNPAVGQSYTLTRFGNGFAPASSVSGTYFRSSGNTALWIWSRNKGDTTHDFLNFAQPVACYGQPINLTGPCGHWQQGIGNPGNGNSVGLSQISIILRFFGVNWVAPYDWQTNPPTGIGPFPPVLYEGSVTLNPSSVVGCPSGYDC